MLERILFGVVFGAIIVGISFFSGKIFSIGFHLSKQAELKTIATSLVIAFVYVLNFFIVRMSDSVFVGTLYTAVNILGGIFFYVFLGAGLLSILLIVGFIGGITLPSWITTRVLGGALLAGIGGMVQSRFITITRYTVELENAPLSWEGKTMALVSDTHFSPINQSAFSKKVTSKITSLSPDFIIHAGDFYDGPMIPLTPITNYWEDLAQNIPVFYAPGNHEMYGNYTAFIESIRETGVTVLEDTATLYDGVQIGGLRYREKNKTNETAEALSHMNLVSNLPTILINHPPTFQKEVLRAGISLMLSGHTHNGQFWPLNYLVKGIYGKYTYGIATDETLTTITTKGVGTFGPPLRLFNTPEIILITFTIKK